MQQDKTEKYEKIILGVRGFLWVAGLLIAGSDTNFMPWVNGIGLLLFTASSILLVKQSSNYAEKNKTAEYPVVYRKVCKKKQQRHVSFIVPATGL